MDELKLLLEGISDTYDDFVEGTMLICKKYPSIKPYLMQYIRKNDVSTSDVCDYESDLIGIPSPALDRELVSLLERVNGADGDYVDRTFVVVRTIPNGKERVIAFLNNTSDVTTDILDKRLKEWSVIDGED